MTYMTHFHTIFYSFVE